MGLAVAVSGMRNVYRHAGTPGAAVERGNIVDEARRRRRGRGAVGHNDQVKHLRQPHEKREGRRRGPGAAGPGRPGGGLKIETPGGGGPVVRGGRKGPPAPPPPPPPHGP